MAELIVKYLVRFIIIMCILAVGAGLLIGAIMGCATPRTSMLFGLNYSDQAPRTLINLECNGLNTVKEGVAVCEEKSPRLANIRVKIMPVPGRVVYSDGLNKKTEDFNYRQTGWIWKKKVIDTTWVPLDMGELNSIYGDVPIAFDVQGLTDIGVINTRGVIYHRVCNDKDVPCSKLIVNYDCSGKLGNTYPGQLGSCVRMSKSSQDFEIPLKANGIVKGAKIRVQSGRTLWRFEREVTESDIAFGSVKFQYPSVVNGPDLFALAVFQWEQGVLQKYETRILLYGFSPEWTGIDQPHFYQDEWCTPFTADLMEIQEGNKLASVASNCMAWKPKAQVCAFAFDRESGDTTYTCIKNGKEERYP